MNRSPTRSLARQSSRSGRAPRQPRPWRSGFTLLALGAVIFVAIPAVVWAVSTADSAALGASGELAAGAEFLTEKQGVTDMQISDITVTGPAAAIEGGVGAADPRSPNRVGSTEIPVRVYEPDSEAWATLVWAHGGSFIHGHPDMPEADWAARRFAEAGVRVYSVDYALASETVKAPAPANDVAAVLARVETQHAGPIAVGGASAGGHLAVEAALQQADRAAASGDASVRPAEALLLEYPTLHRVQRPDSAVAAATKALPEQYRFDAERVSGMYDFYLGETLASARVSRGDAASAFGAIVAGELDGSRLSQLPPTVMVNADADDLRASGEQFAEQLRAAGVPVTLSLQPGTVHGYLNRPDESAQAGADAQQTIDHFVAELHRLVAPVD
ncbi:alpha/beta hydrolase [Leucobacter sp. NPDC058333]|uniref:alpha/beta hydrolase n=1 Tax=Leucobacter sp. NPDC058333 TaxID=3346450 RepID=UPI00365442B4